MLAIAATFAAIALGLPLVILGVECWLALLPLRKHKVDVAMPPRVAVLIPAHNEADLIAETVRSVRGHSENVAQIIVIADNCTDRTAEVARAAGATVWERHDAERVGKGFALNFAWQQLNHSDLDVIVYVDADCVPEGDCIATISRLAHACQRPVQAAYEMHPPNGGQSLASVSALAVYVKNVVRPRGLQWLGWPCLLTGSGMALPTAVLRTYTFPDSHIVEDLCASAELAIAGFPPVPCMEARIESPLPTRESTMLTQRTRWEHGHMSTILTEAPRLIIAAIHSLNWRPLALCLELLVPPLSLLAMTSLAFAAAFVALGVWQDTWRPLAIYSCAAALGGSGLFAAWLVRARSILPVRTAARIPQYMLLKAPMYMRFVHRRQRSWVRTERKPPTAEPNR